MGQRGRNLGLRVKVQRRNRREERRETQVQERAGGGEVKELRREGTAFARVDAELSEDDRLRTQRVTASDEGRAVFADEQRATRLSEYATLTPVVIFHPGDLELTMGGATARRDLLDRVAGAGVAGVGEDDGFGFGVGEDPQHRVMVFVFCAAEQHDQRGRAR